MPAPGSSGTPRCGTATQRRYGLPTHPLDQLAYLDAQVPCRCSKSSCLAQTAREVDRRQQRNNCILVPPRHRSGFPVIRHTAGSAVVVAVVCGLQLLLLLAVARDGWRCPGAADPLPLGRSRPPRLARPRHGATLPCAPITRGRCGRRAVSQNLVCPALPVSVAQGTESGSRCAVSRDGGACWWV